MTYKEPFPFTETDDIRIFAADVPDQELQWHWDEQDRLVIVKSGKGWEFQYDNELPRPMPEGVGFFVQAGVWHRLHKGEGPLTLQIVKS